MTALLPCPSCSRHVRASEAACPFCRTSLSLDPTARAIRTQRLGRAATFAFGAAMTGVVGCGTATTPEDAGAQADAFVAASDTGVDAGTGAHYGGPPADAGTDGGSDAGFSGMYGGPPVDAGDDVWAPAPYGAPPPPPDPGEH